MGASCPRWTRWAAVAVAGLSVFAHFLRRCVYAARLPADGSVHDNVLQLPKFIAISADSEAVQQQVKWFVFGLAVTLILLGIVLIAFAGTSFFEANTMAGQLGFFVWSAFLLVFPLSIMFSILRYRL